MSQKNSSPRRCLVEDYPIPCVEGWRLVPTKCDVSDIRSRRKQYDCYQNSVQRPSRYFEISTTFLTSPIQSKIFKMEAVSTVDGLSFEHSPGQAITNSSPTLTDSSQESLLKAMSMSSQFENPFQSVYDTPQSSVVNIVLRPAPRQTRVARFVECACVSGGPCVGTGGPATCNCNLAFDEVKAPRKAEKKRSIKSAAKGIAKVLKKAWNRPVRALNDATARAMRKQNGH